MTYPMSPAPRIVQMIPANGWRWRIPGEQESRPLTCCEGVDVESDGLYGLLKELFRDRRVHIVLRWRRDVLNSSEASSSMGRGEERGSFLGPELDGCRASDFSRQRERRNTSFLSSTRARWPLT